MTQPLSRRSTLKAGAHAAWVVPAISVVSAAPAYAASLDGLALSGVSARYASTIVEDVETWLADQVTTDLTLTNNDTGPANDVVVSMLIPAGLYDTAPDIVPPAGYAAGTPQGSLATGWTVPAVRALPLGPGDTTGPETFRLEFLDPVDEPPYRGWAGEGFTATVQTTSSSSPSASAVAPVDEAPLTLLEIRLDGTRTNDQVLLSGTVTNVGSRTSGAVDLTVWWDPSGAEDDMWDGEPSLTAVASEESNLTGGARSGAGTVESPWTYTFTRGTRAPLSSFPEVGEPEPAPHCEIPFRISFSLGAGDEGSTGPRTVRMFATAPHATVPVVGSSYGYDGAGVGQTGG